MDAEQVATFLAVLVLGGLAGGIVVAAIPEARARVAESAVPLAAIVAVGALAGSLYFSEGAGYEPCELCWFQRIAMYPMAAILVIAAITRDRRIWRYVVPLAGFGIAVSIYHIQLQLFPDQSSFCDAFNPCSYRWVEGLGFVTIPQMAGACFAMILGLAAIAILDARSADTEPTPSIPSQEQS